MPSTPERPATPDSPATDPIATVDDLKAADAENASGEVKGGKAAAADSAADSLAQQRTAGIVQNFRV